MYLYDLNTKEGISSSYNSKYTGQNKFHHLNLPHVWNDMRNLQGSALVNDFQQRSYNKDEMKRK